MKQTLILLLLLLPIVLFSQRTSVRVKTPIYEVIYNEKLEEPTWIKYTIQCPTGTASRAGMNFYTNDSIKTKAPQNYYVQNRMITAEDYNIAP